MAEIIFSDFYRTVILSLLSACIVFFSRNAGKRKRALALMGYEAFMLIPFLWIFFIAIAFTHFSDESMIDIVLWELKWLLYFSVITILQFVMYQLLWKKSTAYKVIALLLCIIIVVIPFSVLTFQKIIYWNI
ncbi:hypothetical protein [Butyrivibrio sp. XPD2002]|uniref:hypothetical protein n=1 Tax=Butyrivibrio sp. XPD2002 TaxID=1280665 RepID=UPI000478E8F1|nr:hypothetical protein [Butyrivibrio sp. XPD2002]